MAGVACRAEDFAPRRAGIFCSQAGKTRKGCHYSDDVLFPQILNLFGVIAELAQPRVRVLGQRRSRPLRRGIVIGKKKAAAGYFLFSGCSFKLRDEVAAREMRVAK